MNWIEYVRVLQEFRAHFGRMPPSILTEDGALDQIKAALNESSERGAAADESDSAVRHGIRRRREQGH